MSSYRQTQAIEDEMACRARAMLYLGIALVIARCRRQKEIERVLRQVAQALSKQKRIYVTRRAQVAPPGKKRRNP